MALAAVVALACCLLRTAVASNSKVKLVSLLANDAVLDRYAAAVAATEPLREDRDKVLRGKCRVVYERRGGRGGNTRPLVWMHVFAAPHAHTRTHFPDSISPLFNSTPENFNPVQLWWMKATKGSVADSGMLNQKGAHAEAVRQAYTYHVVQSGRIIKSLGLSISDFNTITRRLAHDAQLRNRVLKQAYLYRLESRVNERYDPGMEGRVLSAMPCGWCGLPGILLTSSHPPFSYPTDSRPPSPTTTRSRP